MCLCHHWCFGSGRFHNKWRLCLAPCKEIQDSLGFWIPRFGFRASDSGFPVLLSSISQWNVGFWNPIVSGITDSTRKNLSDSGIWIPLHGLTSDCLRACVTTLTYCLFYCIVHSVIILSFIIEVNKVT